MGVRATPLGAHPQNVAMGYGVGKISRRCLICMYGSEKLYLTVVYVETVMKTTDVAALWDTDDYNAGFIVLKPTNISKQLYREIKSLTARLPKTNDQVALNNVTEALQKQNASLIVTVLNTQRFLSGFEYFEKQRRLFPINNNKKCNQKIQTSCAVVVHNNWIIGKAAKIYRFREHLMWLYDGDDQYYTSSTRLYLTYINREISNRNLFNEKRALRVLSEITALKTAMTIGYLLNRTVILPRFRIERKGLESPLNSLIHIKTFESEFSGKYRENSFLRHPKVPCHVKTGLSELLSVLGGDSNSSIPNRNVTVRRCDIVRQFGNVTARVLVINSLHGVNVVSVSYTHLTLPTNREV